MKRLTNVYKFTFKFCNMQYTELIIAPNGIQAVKKFQKVLKKKGVILYTLVSIEEM